VLELPGGARVSPREILACLLGGPLFALAVFAWLWGIAILAEVIR
jgi:hypothetical protein